MSDYKLFAFLALLVFVASCGFCRCTSEEDFSNIRGENPSSDTQGYVLVPRVGRNAEILNFPRSDRAAGLVQYPRVGRSKFTPNVNFNRFHDLESDTDFEIYNPADFEAFPVNRDYEGHMDKSMYLKHKKVLKDGWLLPDYTHSNKQYRPAQKIHDFRSVYSTIGGPRYNQGRLTTNGFMP